MCVTLLFRILSLKLKADAVNTLVTNSTNCAISHVKKTINLASAVQFALRMPFESVLKGPSDERDLKS